MAIDELRERNVDGHRRAEEVALRAVHAQCTQCRKLSFRLYALGDDAAVRFFGKANQCRGQCAARAVGIDVAGNAVSSSMRSGLRLRMCWKLPLCAAGWHPLAPQYSIWKDAV